MNLISREIVHGLTLMTVAYGGPSYIRPWLGYVLAIHIGAPQAYRMLNIQYPDASFIDRTRRVIINLGGFTASAYFGASFIKPYLGCRIAYFAAKAVLTGRPKLQLTLKVIAVGALLTAGAYYAYPLVQPYLSVKAVGIINTVGTALQQYARPISAHPYTQAAWTQLSRYGNEMGEWALPYLQEAQQGLNEMIRPPRQWALILD